ncbi:MAG: HD domain-containing protein [Coriobacteriia bacterium]|nr:HD domain-containing protein [Coriobacteriia bacterium]
MAREPIERVIERALVWSVLVADAVVLFVCLQSGSPMDLSAALVLAGAYAALSLVSLRLPRGDTLHCGVGIAMAGVLSIGGCETALAVSLGGIAALLVARRTSEEEGLALDLVRAPVLVTGAYWALGHVQQWMAPGVGQLERLVAYMALAFAYVLVDIVTYVALSALIHGERLPGALASFLRLVLGVYLGLTSVGVVLALVYNPESWPSTLLSGAILVLLMLIMKHNFGLFLQVKIAYYRTVGVLARLAEFEREEARGHSERVADIAAGVGRRLHIPNRDLERLNLAALLHAVGRLQSTVVAEPDEGHARLGAQIAESIEFLAPVARIVESHHCRAGEAKDSEEHYLAHIVGVACEFDQLATRSDGLHAELTAWEVMRSRPDDFDSEIVDALRDYRGF